MAVRVTGEEREAGPGTPRHCRAQLTGWIAFALVAAGLGGEARACAAAPDASRIAVAGGSLTEVLYLLGEQARIVAVDSTSVYPPAARELPSLGYVRNLSAEGLLSRSPTLVLGEDDMGPPAVIAQLSATGVSVVRVPEEHTAAGIVEKLRCVARTIAVEERAEHIIETRLAPLLSALQQEPQGSPLRVAVLLGLREGALQGAGRGTSGDGLIRMLGARNAFGGLEGWKPIGPESMALAAPDFLIVSSRGVEQAGGRERLVQHPALRLAAAAREGRLLEMDGMALLGFGPRTLEAALELREQLRETP